MWLPWPVKATRTAVLADIPEQKAWPTTSPSTAYPSMAATAAAKASAVGPSVRL